MQPIRVRKSKLSQYQTPQNYFNGGLRGLKPHYCFCEDELSISISITINKDLRYWSASGGEKVHCSVSLEKSWLHIKRISSDIKQTTNWRWRHKRMFECTDTWQISYLCQEPNVLRTLSCQYILDSTLGQPGCFLLHHGRSSATVTACAKGSLQFPQSRGMGFAVSPDQVLPLCCIVKEQHSSISISLHQCIQGNGSSLALVLIYHREWDRSVCHLFYAFEKEGKNPKQPYQLFFCE